MMPDLDPDTDPGFTRTLAVPRRLTWDCWTQPKHIQDFFIPAPHTVTAVDLDLRVGGWGTVVTQLETYAKGPTP